MKYGIVNWIFIIHPELPEPSSVFLFLIPFPFLSFVRGRSTTESRLALLLLFSLLLCICIHFRMSFHEWMKGKSQRNTSFPLSDACSFRARYRLDRTLLSHHRRTRWASWLCCDKTLDIACKFNNSRASSAMSSSDGEDFLDCCCCCNSAEVFRVLLLPWIHSAAAC